MAWPADHALGLELELTELVSREDEAKQWGHTGDVEGLAPQIQGLQEELADLGEHLEDAPQPVFHGAHRAKELVPRPGGSPPQHGGASGRQLQFGAFELHRLL